MNEDDQNKINIENKKEEEVVKSEENQSQGESIPNEAQTTESSDASIENNENQSETQSEVEEKKENEVVHKKDGRLHIYVRQDKYKGELKSKNWVGRLYIDGKQKISSSGRSNLEEAIPILEKWFDDIHANKGKEEQTPQETSETINEQPATPPEQTAPPVMETPRQTEVADVAEKTPEPAAVLAGNAETSETKTTSSILEKFKNIKFKKPSFSKQDSAPKISASGKSKFKQKIESFLKARLGKKAVQGEEIVGVELTNKEIRLAQISANKANQWVLDKFFIHSVDLPDEASVLDNITASVPQIPANKWTGIAPTTSSIFNLISNWDPNTTIAPPIPPIIIARKGDGIKGSAVIATRPPRAPFSI